jgi:hypothetical protein
VTVYEIKTPIQRKEVDRQAYIEVKFSESGMVAFDLKTKINHTQDGR